MRFTLFSWPIVVQLLVGVLQAAATSVKILRSSDGTEIFAEASGDPRNPHLVLVPGINLSGAIYDDFCKQPSLLLSLYIVRYDLRGQGRSGKPTTAAAYESKLFADDFRAVVAGFGLKKPVFAGWSIGATVASDIAANLPRNTISGVVYIAGAPGGSEFVPQLISPAIINALPGLLSLDDVILWQKSNQITFGEKIFSRPESVPFAVKTEYMGNIVDPKVLGLFLGRVASSDKFFEEGRAGLPIFVLQGTLDGHRAGAPKTAADIIKPIFKNTEVRFLTGIGHAVHYEAPVELANILVTFARKYSGKDYSKR